MIRPLNDRVVVEPDEPAAKIGNIHLPDSAQQSTLRGKVVAVGPGKRCEAMAGDGRLPMTVQVGDRVIYGWGGSVLEHDGKKYLSLREEDILAKIEWRDGRAGTEAEALHAMPPVPAGLSPAPRPVLRVQVAQSPGQGCDDP